MTDDAIPRRWRLAGIGAALACFLLASAAIHISTFKVEYGTRIWLAPEIEAGESAAFRIGVLERPGGRPVRGAAALVSLVSAAEAEPGRPLETAGRSAARIDLGEIEAGDSGYIEDVLPIPEEFEPGVYELLVEVLHPSGKNELAVRRIRIHPFGGLSREDWAVVRPVCEESSSRRPDGGWHPARRCTRSRGRIHLYPDSGNLVAHMSSPIHVWVGPTEEAEKAEEGDVDAVGATPEGFSSIEGLVEVVVLNPAAPGRLETEAARPMQLVLDSLRLGSFEYEPTFPRGSFLLRAEGEEERIWLRDLPAQLGVTADEQLLAPGKNLNISLWLRQPDRPVFIDLWIDGKWAGAFSGRVGGNSERLGIPLPNDARGLVLLRGSLSPEGAGAAVTGAWIDDAPENIAVHRLARALEALPQAEPLAPYPSSPRRSDALIEWMAAREKAAIQATGAREAHRAAGTMLSRLEAALPSAPLLADTTGEKLLAMDAWQERVRRPILAGLLIIGLTSLGCAGWLAVSYHKRVRRRIAELDLDDDDDDSTIPTPGITASGALLPGLALVAVLLAAGAGLLVFLETLSWNRGDVFAAQQREAASQIVDER